MPAYKDTKTGKWYCKFYYKDNEGKNKQKKKMGFTTKSKALEYEREYLLSRQRRADHVIIKLYGSI